jgi:hypothetical protein
MTQIETNLPSRWLKFIAREWLKRLESGRRCRALVWKQARHNTRLLSCRAALQLAAGELQIILENYEASALLVHLLCQEGPRVGAKVRGFIDLLARRVRADPALN